ncbi:UPF0005-domain-containing protein [Cystobasidium minutum MCA 4210]|uniref:UPF0005-domain-containing protein n=1 Tax=Cystobasidium minutum MCA 4210 TaxID=1397322 RepID=UPI0034CFBCEE|eukprot:jgi/Rhomi1/153168/estExt_Genewise1.C_4_t30215
MATSSPSSNPPRDSSSYDVPPPTYAAALSSKGPAQGVHEPLLTGQQYYHHQGYDEANTSEMDDDFEYGSSVASSSIKIRHAFILKVYSALFLQLLGTIIVGGSIYMNNSAKNYVQTHSFCFWVPMLLSLVTMGGLFVYKQQHPINIIMLSAFTLCESLAIGTVVTYYSSSVILLSLVSCTFLVLGLTLFACQTKYDFMSKAGYLYYGLLIFLLVGLGAIFFPFSSKIHAIYSGVGVLLFSGLLLLDTQVIIRRLSPEDWVLGVVSLYLDIINLFLNILNLLARSDDS